LIEQKYKIGPDGKPSTEGLSDLLLSLKQSGAEWIAFGPDSYSTSIADILGPALKEVKLPVFSTTEGNMFPVGVLAGLVSKYYSIGQFCGYKAEQILVQKKAAAEIPIETLKRFSYIIRMEVARELKFYPPVSMFNYAEIL
jgi:putative ABC transport system substrate-binding protein